MKKRIEIIKHRIDTAQPI